VLQRGTRVRAGHVWRSACAAEGVEYGSRTPAAQHTGMAQQAARRRSHINQECPGRAPRGVMVRKSASACSARARKCRGGYRQRSRWLCAAPSIMTAMTSARTPQAGDRCGVQEARPPGTAAAARECTRWRAFCRCRQKGDAPFAENIRSTQEGGGLRPRGGGGGGLRAPRLRPPTALRLLSRVHRMPAQRGCCEKLYARVVARKRQRRGVRDSV